MSILKALLFTKSKNSRRGFSLIEAVLAVSLFSLVLLALISAIVYGRESIALSGIRSRALLIAEEGQEAIRNLRDEKFSNLVDGTYGLATSSNQWVLSGTSDVTDIFTRQIQIGTINSHTKIATTTVTWQPKEGRSGQITLTSYLTEWRRAVGGGMLVYADLSGLDDVLRYKILDPDGNWGPELTIPTLGVPGNRATRRVELYTSPSRNEKILITKHFDSVLSTSQYIFAQVWNGSAWGNSILLSGYANAARPDTRNFDGDYLANGNFLAVYDDNTNIPKYRIWDGSNWSAQNPAVNVGGNPDWIVVRNRPGTNEAMVAVLDASSDTNTFYWNGSSWGGLLEHGTAMAGPQYEDVDFAWRNDGSSGALTFNEAADNFPNIRIWNGTVWSANVENISIAAVPKATQIRARPAAAEFLACFKDSVNDINCLKSDTTPAWTALANGEIGVKTDAGVQRSFSLVYESQSGNPALVVYSNGANAAAQAIPKYRTFNPTTNAMSAENSLTDLGGAAASLETVKLIPDPASDDIIVLLADTSQDIWTRVWNGAANTFYSTGGRGQIEHGLFGSFDEDFWFDFSWNKF
mgnify:FL=1